MPMPPRDPEPSLEDWYVCGEPSENMLFYSKQPVFELANGQRIDLRGASRAHWTQSMHEAHEKLLAFGIDDYASVLDSAREKLVRNTIGVHDEPVSRRDIEQFALVATLRSGKSGLSTCKHTPVLTCLAASG
ncbi:hypothetical protein JCM10908_004475 [Rhodotorula pacifica]|uniref:uncharacterized protein n=1 Tax=Rhodotorula pacifica TaxID=1495444 RepID=UPI003180FFF3